MYRDNQPKTEKRGGRRQGSGRKKFQPSQQDRKLVEDLSGMGIPLEQIACLIGDGISVKTMYKYFEKEMTLGKANANTQVAKTLFKKAVDGDTVSAIWWTKARMGWKETVHQENSGEVTSNVKVALSDKQVEMINHKLENEY